MTTYNARRGSQYTRHEHDTKQHTMLRRTTKVNKVLRELIHLITFYNTCRHRAHHHAVRHVGIQCTVEHVTLTGPCAINAHVQRLSIV